METLRLYVLTRQRNKNRRAGIIDLPKLRMVLSRLVKSFFMLINPGVLPGLAVPDTTKERPVSDAFSVARDHKTKKA